MELTEPMQILTQSPQREILTFQRQFATCSNERRGYYLVDLCFPS